MSIDPKILDSIDTGLALLPSAMVTKEARVMLYSIGLQESRFQHRFQVVKFNPGRKGPARGFWQFERGGGCKGVIEHPASRFWMHRVCVRQNIPFNATELWKQIEHDDALAAIAARLLLFTDPRALPGLINPAGAWNLYIRTWRPGKPHRHTWDAFHQQAVLTAFERAES